MKKGIVTLVLHFILITANAQFFEKNALYLTAEADFGNYKGLNLNLNYVADEKYSLQVGFSGHLREAKSKPEDYSSGLLGIFLFNFGQFITDDMENYQILVGKIYKLNERGNIRLNLAGGIGYTIITEPTNWQSVSGFPIIPLGPNYTYDIDKHSTISLIINPKFEFPFTSIIGLTVSPLLQINKDRTFIGIGIGTMIGVLRER